MVVPKLRDDLLSRNIDNLSPDDLRIMGAAQGRAQPPKKPTENSAQSDIAQERQQPVGQLHPGPSRNTLINKTAVTNELSTIISDFSETKSLVRQRYAEDLSQSLSAFKKLPPPRDFGRGTHDWKRSYRTPGTYLLRQEGIMLQIMRSFSADDPQWPARRVKWLKDGQLWPAITTVTLLQQLSTSGTSVQFGRNVREKIIELGVSMTHIQRELRLRALATKRDEGRYRDEANNWGRMNWAPRDYPDWLLLELEANVLLRPDQVDVALATISPTSKANSVLQMNMGQGKTSCIIPMASVLLANGESLARVIVPKSLRLQTAQLLQARLGGLLNRPIRHIPFSRRTATSPEHIAAYWNLHKTALKNGAVIICQPEHNLSFMLSGRQRFLDNNFEEAKPMIEAYSWITSRSRDILDESDYTLAVRTQLIYPSGAQVSVDGHPHRWQVAEALLHLVDENVDVLARTHPFSIEIVRRPGGGYPVIHFLRTDVENELIRCLTADILSGRGGILPMKSFEAADRIAIKEFIQNDGNARKIRPKTIEHIRNLCPSRPAIRQTVYLVRGLLVNRILMMTLKKRWNVHYGLHPERDPIAVPYHAKGVPSLQSEWGHPDVSILFTCLAFYYDGITKDQLRRCLEHLFRSDEPSGEYDRWTKQADKLSDSLRAWKSINVDDNSQLTQLWTHLRYTTAAIDYFLNNFVFQLYAKQFKFKLQSSGWDIPLFSLQESSKGGKENIGRPLKAITTGFSGTNDNRTMLPLTIKQEDLPALAHTNAEVLTYLLHPRSRKCVKIRNQGEQASELNFLHKLHNQKIRVLIDAGAVILEMNNKDLAKAWLKIDKSAPGVLYFDEASKPWIMGRSESLTPLLASPFAEDLGSCLVYLDEAHTRGTDLKLPSDACGALTLSLGQTKDHTVQAAMRLRQLGTTQSVSFFAPPEVWQSILDFRDKAPNANIDSSDVISWLLNNTCDGIEQLQPLYYAQGNDFCRRMDAETEAPNMLSDKCQRQDYVAAIKQSEQQSLSQLYKPVLKPKSQAVTVRPGRSRKVAGFMRELTKRRKAFQDSGKAVHGSALEVVEQEREVAFEVESVRQVKKPQRFPALSFTALHPELEVFARTGRLAAQPQAITHAFTVMARSAVGRKFRVSATAVTTPQLFVSNEYERTVRLPDNQPNDNFTRPVHWILWSEQRQVAIIVVPEEAEELVPVLRGGSADSPTFLMAYSAPATRKMMRFDQLKFFSIPELPEGWSAPSWLRVQLGIFAGRLFFDWEDYSPICDFMGVDGSHVTPVEEEDEEGLFLSEPVPGTEEEEDADVDAQWVAPRKPADGGAAFSTMPLTCMQEWLSIRRHGQDFVQTPMGFLTQGKTLQKEHAFFS